MYLGRSLEDRWVEVSRNFPALLLTGPRQVGKTTLLRHLCGADRSYVTLDDPISRQLARQDPALFLERYPAPVLIDEIQYAPQLLQFIKIAIDRNRTPGGYWLTGSQQFLAMKGVTETLAGRVALVSLLGFSQRELRQSIPRIDPFLLDADGLADRPLIPGLGTEREVFRAIWMGSMPALAAGETKEHDLFFSSYVQTYLQRDVRDLTQVGDQDAFLRFVRACAARTAQLLNLSDLARDVDCTVTTIKNWLSILEASHQILLLRPFHSNLTKRLSKSPKLHFLDTGLCSYLTEWSSPETLAAGAMAGAVFESYVIGEILKSWWHRIETPHLYHYRDRDKREIDIVFERDGFLHPVEIKRSASPRREWARCFLPLERLKVPVGSGAVICLSPERVALDKRTWSLPVACI